MERLTFRVHALAFPIWTFAVTGGTIWAEAAWGRCYDQWVGVVQAAGHTS